MNIVNPSYSTLVLLTGPPRSGTTWLNREICNGNHVFNFLPECSLLTKQIELFSTILHYTDPQRFSAYFSNTQNLVSYYQDNIMRMIDLIVKINKNQGDGILVLKDPELSLYLGELIPLLPKHKLIVLIRDPRDVLASMKNVVIRKQQIWNVEDISNQIFKYYYHIDQHIEQASPNTLFVRYEDLVVQGLEKVHQFLQQENDTNLKQTNYESIQEKINSADPFFSELYFQPTTQEKIGTYKNILTETELNDIEKVYSGVIQRWGY